MSKEDKEYKSLFPFYEKAIEGRNQHYQNYSKQMNYYSLFTGAFFIAYYNIFGKNVWLSSMVALLGFVTAICWKYSLSGYYAWMVSWIKLVQEYENRMNEKCKTPFVYKYADECLRTTSGFPQNYSTQKVTELFLNFVIIAWGIVVVVQLHQILLFLCAGYRLFYCCYMLPIVVVALIYLGIAHYLNNKCRSSLENMVNYIYQKDNSKK